MDQMKACIQQACLCFMLAQVPLVTMILTTICSHTAPCIAGGALRDALMITR